MHITRQDEQTLKEKGIDLSGFIAQLHRFTQETKPVKLERPCTLSDGIVNLSATECLRLQRLFESEGRKKRIQKFVPASGAATRMFKHLHNYNPAEVSDLTEEFILRFNHFPFLEALAEVMAKNGHSLTDEIKKNNWALIFDFILSKRGLYYDSQLKGMVLFHKYDDGARTAFEEHLYEAAEIAKQENGECHIHFTLAPQNIAIVSYFLQNVAQKMPYEHFVLTYSVQNENTDTIALNKDNEPVRGSDGKFLFRPAGHGALIHNLQSLDADVIFIKNIDNVTKEENRHDADFYKKTLAGLLIELKSGINKYLINLKDGDASLLEQALEFVQLWFQPGLPIGMDREGLRQYAMHRLARPLRVCGMVKNEGEPGGGPFWVMSAEGIISKQIVEKSQVDLDDVIQSKILSASTHFNPVDIVCNFKDLDGKNYNLENFVDHSTGFISEKFHEGQVIKALELPGLWNGAMALWNTVFVEVPVSTFNPVKTVNDLLRAGHQ